MMEMEMPKSIPHPNAMRHPSEEAAASVYLLPPVVYILSVVCMSRIMQCDKPELESVAIPVVWVGGTLKISLLSGLFRLK
ncbi:hypothetical protein ACQKWADRAFT_2845 [Trichoderma austrokoningii]